MLRLLCFHCSHSYMLNMVKNSYDSQSSFLSVILLNHITKTTGLYINTMQINFRFSAVASHLSSRLQIRLPTRNCFPNTLLVPQTQNCDTVSVTSNSCLNPYSLQLSDFHKCHNHSLNLMELNSGNIVTLGIQINMCKRK